MGRALVWSDEELRLIVELLQKDYTQAAIAAVIGRTESSVRRCILRHAHILEEAEKAYAKRPHGKRFPGQRPRKRSDNDEVKEAAAIRRRAGLTVHASRPETGAERGWRAQMPLMPRDTRNLTAYMFGDPIPDPRAPWRGGGQAR